MEILLIRENIIIVQNIIALKKTIVHNNSIKYFKNCEIIPELLLKTAITVINKETFAAIRHYVRFLLPKERPDNEERLTNNVNESKIFTITFIS